MESGGLKLMTAKQLLLEIARCDAVAECFSGGSNACAKIIDTQRVDQLSEFQAPEPWMGQIEVAPVLFLASNPSIDRTELFPTDQWPDGDIESFFSHRFSDSTRWLSGRRALRVDGTYGRSIPFYGRVLGLAAELMDRPPVLGADIAFTEVVHCKSEGEVGVREALASCSDRYLHRVLSVAAANIIVVLGKSARRALNEVLPETTTPAPLLGPISLGGKERFIAYLPHPNAHMKRRFRDVMPTELPILRAAVQSVR